MYSKMLEEYSAGTGSMAAEAEKTANSWEGSLNRLSNTWTSVVNNVANSDGIISGINALNSLLNVVDKITSALGTWGTIGVGAGLFAGFKNVGRGKILPLVLLNMPTHSICSFCGKTGSLLEWVMKYIALNSRYGLNRLDRKKLSTGNRVPICESKY